MSRRRRSGRRRWGGPLGVLVRLALLGVAWLLAVAAYIAAVGDRDDPRPRDAAIVLGAAAYHVRPSPVFEERIRHGVDLYEAGRVRALVFTGGFGNGAPYAESQVARRFARAQGVPDEAIVIETVSTTTRGNLQEAARLMREHGLDTAVVVSDPLHMARALRLARDAGIDATGSPTPTTRFRSWRVRGEFLGREVYFFHRDRAEALWARLRATPAPGREVPVPPAPAG